MKKIILKDFLKSYKKNGWIAVKKSDNTVVTSADTFSDISERVKKSKGVYLFPASDNYFGIVTFIK